MKHFPPERARSKASGSATGPVPEPRHPARQVRAGIPPTGAERSRLLQLARHYVAEYTPVPPVPLAQLREHAARLLAQFGCAPEWKDFTAVLINNEINRETLASIPFSKRLLLLPKCLRVESQCRAEMDEFGLLCKRCGHCNIFDFQKEAERLGYAVLVAEGSAMVTSLIRSGKVEAVIGVSCLNVLEKAFPYMEAAAIPGVAIPLLQDDCAETTVDLDWVWDYLHLSGEDHSGRLNLSALRQEVEGWFTISELQKTLGPARGEAEFLAREFLARGGKRWRPFLAVAAFEALSPLAPAGRPLGLRRLAAAVECFHKASLIHDDIEDNDPFRYGEKTLHAQHGVAVALNVGDLLIGEGYRLLAGCEVEASLKERMIGVAAEGQRQLCRGQGAELAWMRAPQPLGSAQIIEIFRQKTAPAFEVALKLGALYAQSGGVEKDGDVYGEIAPVLQAFSEALGIAYQIRDDLNDYLGEGSDLSALRPGLLPALAWEQACGAQRTLLESFWRRQVKGGAEIARVAASFESLQAVARARQLLETWKAQSVAALTSLADSSLKGLLRRLITRIFIDTELQGWCAARSPASALKGPQASS